MCGTAGSGSGGCVGVVGQRAPAQRLQVYAPVDNNPGAFHRSVFVFISPQVGAASRCLREPYFCFNRHQAGAAARP